MLEKEKKDLEYALKEEEDLIMQIKELRKEILDAHARQLITDEQRDILLDQAIPLNKAVSKTMRSVDQVLMGIEEINDGKDIDLEELIRRNPIARD